MLRCLSPDAKAPATRAAARFGAEVAPGAPLHWRLEVSANGQQYSTDDNRFVQYPAPPAHVLLPSGGPSAGGTTVEVSGAGLRNGSEYRCRFGRARLEVALANPHPHPHPHPHPLPHPHPHPHPSPSQACPAYAENAARVRERDPTRFGTWASNTKP